MKLRYWPMCVSCWYMVILMDLSPKMWQKGKFVVIIRFDGEFDVWIDAVYVFSELFNVVFVKYGERVIHVS